MLCAIEITSQASPSSTHAETGSILCLIIQLLAVYTLKGVKDVVGNSGQLSQHLGDTERRIRNSRLSLFHRAFKASQDTGDSQIKTERKNKTESQDSL